jgi:hypothetical protein
LSINTWQVNPQIVRIEKFESLDGLEVFDMVLWDLCDFEESKVVLILHERASLHVCLRLVRHFHHEFGLLLSGCRVEQHAQNIQVHRRSQVVHVRDEAVLPAIGEESVEQPRVAEGEIEISVTWWVPPKRSQTEKKFLSQLIYE